MKKLLYLACAGLFAISISSCGDDKDDTPGPITEDHVLTGEISADKTLTNDKAWTLKGYVYVKSGAKLIIPAGTVIKSDIIEKGALIVETGGQLMAEGTAAAPIVFTSGQPKGQRRPGDWGGIILLGNATTNRGTNPRPTIEGGVARQYGGTNDADNSGTMRYVRIEYAGIAAQPNSEINGLTFGGVGSGTIIENIMVSYANDDAYEFFGGTVNCKNLIAYACSDDDFDFDFGYSGKIQYGISIKHPQFADPGDASNGIEADNDADGSTATPNTKPQLSNFTFIGPNGAANTQANHNLANRWRRNVNFVLRNSILIGHQKGGFSLESAGTVSSYQNGTSEFKNNILRAVTANFKSDQASFDAAAMETKALSEGVVIPADMDAVGLEKPFSWYTEKVAPNVMPKSGSVALAGADFSGMNAFFTTVTFRGAIGTTNWTANWTNWDPTNTEY
ncbi:MAG: hypothetical protein WC756_07540 [Taibaiella sp.]|jgi:hypothetical protein